MGDLCPKCGTQSVNHKKLPRWCYECDNCGAIWRDSKDFLILKLDPDPEFSKEIHELRESQKKALDYLDKQEYPVIAEELADALGIDVPKLGQVITPLTVTRPESVKEYMIGTRRFYFPYERACGLSEDENAELLDYMNEKAASTPKWKRTDIRTRDDETAKLIPISNTNMVAAANAKDEVLRKGKSLMPQSEFEDLTKKYGWYLDSLSKLTIDANFNYNALAMQQTALKAKKFDPAIAGGLASGVAGVGAGVYSAVSQQQRNNQIDLARAEAAAQVYATGAAANTSKIFCENGYYSVMAYINAYPELQSIFYEEKSKLQQKGFKEKSDQKQTKSFSVIMAIIAVIILGVMIFSGASPVLAILVTVVICVVSVLVSSHNSNHSKQKLYGSGKRLRY